VQPDNPASDLESLTVDPPSSARVTVTVTAAGLRLTGELNLGQSIVLTPGDGGAIEVADGVVIRYAVESVWAKLPLCDLGAPAAVGVPDAFVLRVAGKKPSYRAAVPQPLVTAAGEAFRAVCPEWRAAAFDSVDATATDFECRAEGQELTTLYIRKRVAVNTRLTAETAEEWEGFGEYTPLIAGLVMMVMVLTMAITVIVILKRKSATSSAKKGDEEEKSA
jgi:hypothetical protein